VLDWSAGLDLPDFAGRQGSRLTCIHWIAPTWKTRRCSPGALSPAWNGSDGKSRHDSVLLANAGDASWIYVTRRFCSVPRKTRWARKAGKAGNRERSPTADELSGIKRGSDKHSDRRRPAPASWSLLTLRPGGFLSNPIGSNWDVNDNWG